MIIRSNNPSPLPSSRTRGGRCSCPARVAQCPPGQNNYPRWMIDNHRQSWKKSPTKMSFILHLQNNQTLSNIIKLPFWMVYHLNITGSIRREWLLGASSALLVTKYSSMQRPAACLKVLSSWKQRHKRSKTIQFGLKISEGWGLIQNELYQNTNSYWLSTLLFRWSTAFAEISWDNFTLAELSPSPSPCFRA